MSYEGYEQHICANGHRFNTDMNYYDFYDEYEPPKCSCGAKSVWYNSVDQTNYDQYYHIPAELFQHESYGKVKVPSDEEHKAMQTYLDFVTGDVLFVNTNKKFVPSVYTMCSYEYMECSFALGMERAQELMNNLCS